MTHGSVAKRVREHKTARPDLYCSHPGCLWRVEPGKPCPKHTPPDIFRLVGGVRKNENSSACCGAPLRPEYEGAYTTKYHCSQCGGVQ
jgi:hypothetical protein